MIVRLRYPVKGSYRVCAVGLAFGKWYIMCDGKILVKLAELLTSWSGSYAVNKKYCPQVSWIERVGGVEKDKLTTHRFRRE